MSGGYHVKRVNIGAWQERVKDMPNKNESSHIGDAYGYLLTGGGEHKRMTTGRARFGDSFSRSNRPNAVQDFDVFSL